MVQTGPKTQLGGEKIGLFKVIYQLGIVETVKNEPIAPAPKQIPIDKRSFGKLSGINLSISDLLHLLGNLIQM